MAKGRRTRRKSNPVTEKLAEIGAVLIRRKKHEVWRLPNGRNFVRPQTGSDQRGWKHELTDLRRAMREVTAE